ncbi:MAG: peptidoglycan-binding protein LysM [Proteobacteria bacterium]|nr:peptidoglycan-binding protein LysM [Pseudomonadota bacterium]
MGLLDFAADIGKKLFGDDDPAETMQKYIEDDNPGVDGLEVVIENDVATVKGKAEDKSAWEKVILMAGNVLGISEVQADELEVEDDSAPAAVYYTIVKGDTLWGIASEHLGNGSRHPEIFEANREVIKDPNLIYPGQKIRIPVGE